MRDYGINGQIGLEKTPEEYVQKFVVIFREIRRVLKKDGTCWLNLGDTYNAGRKGGWAGGKNGVSRPEIAPNQSGVDVENLKPKDLIGIPWRVAFALQQDGWWLRQDIIWSKPNPMPESVTDRCTKSHEYIFLLSKSKNYYYDAEAIKEEFQGKDERIWSAKYDDVGSILQGQTNAGIKRTKRYPDSNGRNKRSVWTITTKPFSGAHFAAFPEDLIEPMIKAGTSEKGICPDCGKLWIRITQNKSMIIKRSNGTHEKGRTRSSGTMLEPPETKTLGWRSSCKCDKEPIPAIVLDPFMGSGTTALVARKLLRHYIGFDLNPDYVKMAQDRLNGIPSRLESFVEMEATP